MTIAKTFSDKKRGFLKKKRAKLNRIKRTPSVRILKAVIGKT